MIIKRQQERKRNEIAFFKKIQNSENRKVREKRHQNCITNATCWAN